MRRVLSLGLTACLLAQPALAAQNAPVEFQRTGKWAVDWNENSCALIGSFGSGRDAVALKFIQLEPGDSFTLQAFGLPFPVDGTTAQIDVDFAPFDNPRRQQVLHGTAGDLGLVDLGSNRIDDKDASAAAVTPAVEAQATAVTLTPLEGAGYRLITGSLEAPMKALRDCTRDLVRHWGYDPAVQSVLTRPASPVSDAASWLSASDYPAPVFRSGSSAVINVRLDIDEAGAVTGCHVFGNAKAASLADATCKNVMQRARLSPALDAQGKPVKSYFVNEYRWAMVDR